MSCKSDIKKVIEAGELGMYELGWLDETDNKVGRKEMIRELKHDIVQARQNIGQHNHSSFAEDKRARLDKAEKMLIQVENRWVKRNLIDIF